MNPFHWFLDYFCLSHSRYDPATSVDLAELFLHAPQLKELIINHHTIGFGSADGPKPNGLLMRSLIHIEMNGIDCDSDDVLRSILACCPNLEVSFIHE